MKGLFSRGTRAALLACFLLSARAEAQTSLEIYAGGAPFVSGPGNSVPVSPRALALAPNGDLYVADDASGKILRFDPATSTISSVPNLPGLLEYRFAAPKGLGYGPGAVLNLMAGEEQWQLDLVDGFRIYVGPVGPASYVTFGPDGTMYFTRTGEHAVYRRTPSGSIEIVAGDVLAGFSGDGTTSARFRTPRGVAIDAAGNLYIADSSNSRIRRRAAATGIITTIAGTGATIYNGNSLLALQTNLSVPTHLAVDAAGNLYISEAGNYRIRRLNASNGRIINFAGNGTLGGSPGNGGPAVGASLNGVVDLEVAGNGTLYIAEADSYRVRKVDTSGIISQIIGNGTRSFCGEGVPAREACLSRPNGLTIDDAGDVYFSDQNNRRVRKISAATGIITTVAGGDDSLPDGDGGLATATRLSGAGPAGIAVDAAKNLYVAVNGRVRRIDGVTGIITAFAGTTTGGSSAEGVPAVSARFNGVSRVAVDSSGNVYITDIYNNRVRRVNAVTGIITTIAGNGSDTGPLGDGGLAIHASLAWPHNLAFDADGNLLIGDTNHYLIRKVNLTTGVITTVAGNGTAEINGNGGPAIAAGIGTWPAFDIDADGNIYVTAGFELRRIDAQTGIIDRAPAPIWGLYTPEGRSLENPNDMVLGADNRLYITDAAANNLVLRVSGLPTAVSDLTPPVIEPVISGTPGLDGWYRSNVQISWSVTDPESAITTSSGCAQSEVLWDTEGANFHCIATSEGGTAERHITIKRDTVAPQLTFGTPSPAPDASGWNSTDVLVPFNATDALSGVYSTSSASPATIVSTGSNRTASVVVTDFAGNSATFTTPAVNIDRSPPGVVGHVSGTLGSNNWYTSDVQVSWTVTAGASPVSSSEGCDTSTVTADTSGVTFTCAATSAGGTNTQSVTVKRDATAPQLEYGAPSPAPGADGWFTGDVTFQFTASDATSGVSSPGSSGNAVVTGTGTGLTAQVAVTDGAGNSATFTTPAVNIANTPPVITAQLSGTLGSNGWYRSDVQLTWTIDELPENIDWTSGCGTYNVTADTAGVSYSCGVQSTGGYTSKTVSIKRDATAPVITITQPANGATYTVGQSETSSFSCTDAHMQSCTGTVADGAAFDTSTPGTKTFTVDAMDLAGNTSTLVRTYTVQ